MNSLREASQHGVFQLLFLEPMQHIKTTSDLFTRDRILVCDKLGANPLQKDCLRKMIVPVLRVVMEVEGLLVVAH